MNTDGGLKAWDLVEGYRLFFAKKKGTLDDEQHLAEMVSLMGPPPLEFLQRSQKCQRYWDAQGIFFFHSYSRSPSYISVAGNWKGSIPIPEQSLEMREQQFSGEDKKLFLNFLRKILRWLPDERPTAEELAYDEFLMQPVLADRV